MVVYGIIPLRRGGCGVDARDRGVGRYNRAWQTEMNGGPVRPMPRITWRTPWRVAADPPGDPVDGRRALADDRPDRVGAQPIGGDSVALADPPEQRPFCDAGGFEVAVHCRDRGSAEEPHGAVPSAGLSSRPGW